MEIIHWTTKVFTTVSDDLCMVRDVLLREELKSVPLKLQIYLKAFHYKGEI